MSAQLKPLTPDQSPVHRFGALLRRWRIEAGLSQPELSAKLYTSKSTISRAETGVRLLAPDLVEGCDALVGAAGALLAAWQRAHAAPRIDSPDRGMRFRSAEVCLPRLCDLALRACHRQVVASGQLSLIPLSFWFAEPCLIQPSADRGRYGHGLLVLSCEAELGRHPRSSLGLEPLDPLPAGMSLRTMFRLRPDACGPAPSGSAGGSFPRLAFHEGRSSEGLAAASKHRRGPVALMRMGLT
jgi:transcriptional regulator with XRE-family HTH domain